MILKSQLKGQKNRHILVVSQYFYPEQMRINDICQEWIKRGYKVTVLTGIPNYPKGKFYDGYSLRKKRRENWNGIDIIRIPVVSRGNSSVKLILNYFSFVFSGFFWSIFNKIKADIVYIYEVSPMTQVLPGIWYAKKNKIPCMIYITDLWPDNIEYIASVNNKFILSRIEKMCQYIYKNSNMILTSSRSFIDILLARKVSSKKLKFWPQYAEDFYKLESKTNNEIPDDNKFNILFAGNIGFSQGLDILPDVANILKQKNIDVRFNILGDGRVKEDLILLVKKSNVRDMFNFIDKKPPERVSFYIANSDAVLISLIKNKAFEATIPAKLQSYLACGKPVIVSADGEIQEIIKQANAGLCSGSGDVLGLANIIDKLISLSQEDREEMGRNAVNYNKKNFNKHQRLDEIDSWIKELINENLKELGER